MIFTQNGPNVWRASRTAGRLSGSITEQGSSFSGLPAESMNEATRFAAPLSTGALFFEKNRPVNGGSERYSSITGRLRDLHFPKAGPQPVWE